MWYSIFRNGLLVTNVKPLDNSELSQKKQSEDIIRLNFVLDAYVNIKVGDYIIFPKTKGVYKLNKNPRVIENPSNYQYDCIFEGTLHELKKTKVFLSTPKTGGSYKDYKFPLTGTAKTFLDFIVANLNRNGGSYSAGTYVTTGTATIEFNNWDAFEAITEISKTLNFSWYLQSGVLHFTEKLNNTAYVFQVGRLTGFVDLSRMRLESEDIETVVYGYGSTDNLPPRTASEDPTYDGNLLTENRLSFLGVNNESKLEKNVSQFGRIESVQEFNDIKPERVGTVTAISSTVNDFIDGNIDFDINTQILPGIKPKLSFLSGSLIGLNFEILFDNNTKQITLVNYIDESGTYPNSLIKPAVGDSYILFDIMMPTAYIDAAKVRLQAATLDYLDKKSKSSEVFEARVDSAYIEMNQILLHIGDFIRIVSTTFGIDNYYEIKELVQNITNIYLYTLKFGDVVPSSLVKALQLSNFSTKQDIYNIQRTTYTTTEVNNQITNNIGEPVAWQSL